MSTHYTSIDIDDAPTEVKVEYEYCRALSVYHRGRYHEIDEEGIEIDAIRNMDGKRLDLDSWQIGHIVDEIMREHEGSRVKQWANEE